MAQQPRSKLKSFLMQKEMPDSLVMLLEGGEKEPLPLRKKGRGGWDEAEATLLSSNAVAVQCLRKNGTVIRSEKLENLTEDADSDADNREDRAIERHDRSLSNERREMAMILREQGVAIKEAYREGAEAASSAQGQLTELVSMLTSHLALAITNLHNVSVNLGNLIAEASGGEGDQHSANGDMIKSLLGTVLARQLGGGGPAMTPNEAANGAPHGKGKK